MENTPSAEPVESTHPALASEKPKNEWLDLGSFLVKLVIIVIIVRSFIFSPFSIPSESMLPRLLIGDYLFITKFNYGYSRHSLPWSWPLIPGRIFAGDPARGDVVVFKAPGHDGQDWIKRVIGLPGDTVQMKEGVLILNGKAVPKERIADFLVPISPNFPAVDAAHPEDGKCGGEFLSSDDKGNPVCRFPQFRETLPNGVSYNVLDQGMQGSDNTEVFTVPAGNVFLMGDNRDDSADSRFERPPPGSDKGGISYVPMENLEGKAVVNFWSTDGSAQWLLPWTWFTAARWSRLGNRF